MADRFPSIEDFAEGQTEPQGNGIGIDGLDSGDDFLSRERAALGDDANQFAGPGDSSNLSANFMDGDDDLLGGGNSYSGGQAGGEEVTEFESSFPAIDTRNEGVAPGGTITGSTAPFQSQPSYSSYSAPEEEPEVIKQWRERRDLGLQHRSEVSASKKAETVKAAQSAIDDFYENYNTKKDKTIAQTQKDAEEFLANREDTAAGGTSWDRIAKLVDLSGKGARGGASGTGKERFRELLLSLRKDEKAPGSTGY
ncbi:hypothetical protein MMC20_005431 [Loxospora ochrophaea]|nr:hypothetical protein [Loxospora ochrophaea]